MWLDAEHNDVYVALYGSSSSPTIADIIRVNLDDGVSAAYIDPDVHGEGPLWGGMGLASFDEDRRVWLLFDHDEVLYEVDLDTGDRVIISR